MTQREIERLTVIETKFETIIIPMAFKVDQIHDALPEITRKVNKHHEVFAEHCEIMGRVGVQPKRLSDGNGGLQERRIKKNLWIQFKELPLPKKLSILVIGFPFVGGYWDWLLTTSHKVISWLQTIT